MTRKEDLTAWCGKTIDRLASKGGGSLTLTLFSQKGRHGGKRLRVRKEIREIEVEDLGGLEMNGGASEE